MQKKRCFDLTSQIGLWYHSKLVETDGVEIQTRYKLKYKLKEDSIEHTA